jgi:chromosome segregation ATPase
MIDFVEDHAKAVVLSLAVLLAVWGVASGIWIANLRAAIAARDAALTEGIEKTNDLRESLEQRHKEELAALKTENAYLTEQVAILRRTATRLSAALGKITAVLNEASAGSANSASYRPELAKAVADLERETDEMSRAVKELEDRSAPGESAKDAAVTAESSSSADRRAPSSAAAWIALTVVALGLLACAVYLYRRFQDLQGREQRLKQERERLKRPLIRNSVSDS